jgi:hypothetical protein
MLAIGFTRTRRWRGKSSRSFFGDADSHKVEAKIKSKNIMKNVWKVGSRWSEYGLKKTCIVSVFRRNNIVFIGNNDNFRQIKAGDYLAIADGYDIIAVAKAITDADELSNIKPKIEDFALNEREENFLKYSNNDNFISHSFGVKVNIVDLDKQLKYEKRTRFCRINKEKLIQQITDKYENHGKEFSIQSFTGTLSKSNTKENLHPIFDSKTKYIVPIYQRPYSWSEKELEPFINDIFKGFWGIDKMLENQEPMFIGTMQLSEKKFIDKDEYEQHIIDGQQRLSTFLVLIKYLSLKFPENSRLIALLKSFSLETQVTEEQQNYLTQFISVTEIPFNEDEQNPYLRNALIIENYFEQNIERNESEFENTVDFQIDKFIDYITKKIYFVVIETYAGLSKMLQIFNAINTTGLDLNGGDVFKIRMYEYLTSKKGQDAKIFDEISRLYGKIENYNKELGQFFSITNILSIYQYIIVAKYNLPSVLYHYGTDTFFERLFDTIFNINQWEHFKNNVQNVELALEDIEQLIDIRYNWEQNWQNKENFTAEDICAIHFIWRSRYSKYWLLTFVFLYKYKDWNKMLIFNRQLNKLFFIYSVRFQKLKNDIYYTAMQEIISTMINNNFEETISVINEYIGNEETNNPDWYDLNWFLSENLVENAKRKNLICRMSAMIEENYTTVDIEDVKTITTNLWEKPIDIEHIQSHNDRDEEKREKIWEEWGNDINSLGNLMVLEEDINRSISNYSYEIKLPRYKESKYEVARLQAKIYASWNLNKCHERKDKELHKILDYLFKKE